MKARFNEIHTTDELDALVEKSNEHSVIIFKHSTTCPISHGVYREVSNADADINLIVMQTARNVSTAIAERTGIRHESPQALILKDGKVVYHASHYDVTAEDLMKEIKRMAGLVLSAFILLVAGSFNLFAQEQIKVIRAVAPKYNTSEGMTFCGKVTVQIDINSEGSVANTKAISGHPKLRTTSQNAAGKWLFSPFDTGKTRKVDLIFNFECEYKTDDEDVSIIYDSPYQINILFPKEKLKVVKSN